MGDVYQLITTEPKTVDENAQKQEVTNTLLAAPPQTSRCVYVTDSLGKLQGIITIEEIINSIAVKIGHIPNEEGKVIGDLNAFEFQDAYKGAILKEIVK